MEKTLLFAFSFLLGVLSMAAAPLEDFPGSIPLKYERQAASDLVYQGRVLKPDEARELYESGKIINLSHLSPDDSSVLWKNRFLPETSNEWNNDFHKLELTLAGEELTFTSDHPAPNGQFAFLAQKPTPSGGMRSYQVYLDLKGHNMLVRRGLLRKIGYTIPPIVRIKKMRLKFQGAFSKREFVKRIGDFTFSKPSRWVLSDINNEDDFLDLQDVFVFEGPDDPYYNLARGDIDSSIIRGRRILNSLLIPFSLTDFPESLNLASWVGAGIFNGQLYMPYPDAEAFSPSYEDALWMARRVLKLTREDWISIVRGADVPSDVAELWAEKLIERRNSVRKGLNLVNEFPEIQSYKKPQLTGEIWSGYARHFSGTEPESPFSAEEKWGLAKSKFLSNLISNLVLQFNARYVPGTDVAFNIFDHELNLAAKNFAEFIMTKQVKQNPVAVWATPFYNGQLIASREIIAGNYMGSDNLVQLADTFGFSVNLGYAAILDNLPINVAGGGNFQVSLVQRYTHLKPVTSIKSALSEKFRNMFVPYLILSGKLPLQGALDLEMVSKVLAPEELKKQLDAQITEFTKELGIGESLVVTSSVSPNGFLKLSRSLTKDVEAYAKLSDQFVKVSRVQILRKDATTVQIYLDPATYNNFALALGLSVGIPIMELGKSWENGSVQTNYFTLNIDTDLKKNPNFFEQLRILLGVFKGASLDFMKSRQAPWIVQHDFDDDNFKFKFLFWHYLKDNLEDRIQVTHPSGSSGNFVRRALGKRTGVDYESLAIEVLNYLLAEKTQSGIQLGSSNSGNPGDTLYGSAVSRQTVGEAEVNEPANSFLSVNYHWKGWEMSRARLLKMAQEINSKFGSEVIQDGHLNDIEKLQFYNVYVQISLYTSAIRAILAHSEKEIRDLFDKHSVHPPDPEQFTNFGILPNPWANSVIRSLQIARSQLAQPKDKIDYRKLIGELAEILDICESQLDYPGFLSLVGGEKNIFVNGSIVGFRKGTENGNQPLRMQTIGKIGSSAPLGPLQKLQSDMNISGGEFNINWIINGL